MEDIKSFHLIVIYVLFVIVAIILIYLNINLIQIKNSVDLENSREFNFNSDNIGSNSNISFDDILFNTAVNELNSVTCIKINDEFKKSTCLSLVEFHIISNDAVFNRDVSLCNKLEDNDRISSCLEFYNLTMEVKNE